MIYGRKTRELEGLKGHRVRVVDIDGSPWFVAADVCRALGLKPHTSGGWGHHLGRLGESEVTPISELGVNAKGQGMNHAKAITESGLYKLVLRSDKDTAKEFQNWVTRDVLPAIRKDGMYVQDEEKVATGAR